MYVVDYGSMYVRILHVYKCFTSLCPKYKLSSLIVSYLTLPDNLSPHLNKIVGGGSLIKHFNNKTPEILIIIIDLIVSTCRVCLYL